MPRAPHASVASSTWDRAEPLWKVVPKRDGAGRAYADFMMLAPGLKGRSRSEMDAVQRVIRGVLARFGDAVVFADFNLSIRVLWVTLQHRPGLMFRVVAALRVHVPALKLVAYHPHQGACT
ncbi:MAG TPA: hypothetical protein PKH69_09300 [Thiobacillaceae bacterium]|nr:hypothetical protein [Thiobacillaceae bacterium]